MRVALSRLTRPLLFNCGTDIPDRSARRMHLHCLLCHVEADAALHAVLGPLRHVAVWPALLDETILVAAVAAPLAPAEAGDVAQHLGMFGGEPVGRGDDLR